MTDLRSRIPGAGALLRLAPLGMLACLSLASDPLVATTLRELEGEYGISIVTARVAHTLSSFRSDLHAADPSPAALSGYVPILRRQVSKYPDDAFQCADVDTLVLASELRVPSARDGPSRQGSRGDASPGAVPAFADRALIYDVDVAAAAYVNRYYERCFHHEFFHMLDRADDGEVDSDPAWSALNPDGFEYGSGGASVSRFVSYFDPIDTREGFVTAYGTLGVEEDKAEIFSLMHTFPELLQRRAASDPVIAAKVAQMNQILSRACPSFVPDGAP
jgi:hypothetical protein